MPKIINDFRGEYRWLSNFHIEAIYIRDVCFISTEHIYQAYKAESFADFERIRTSPSCRGAKTIGGKIKLRDGWDDLKLEVMYYALILKFHQSKELRQKLLDTGDAILIEGNTWGDRYWGVCNGVGENMLGGLLEEVRDIASIEKRLDNEAAIALEFFNRI